MDLGERIKRYEEVSQIRLTRRMPAIIRIDGKAFHTYTKGMEKPWDIAVLSAMLRTAKSLCENIQGAQMAYHQSDEISILLVNYPHLNTDSWFDKKVQK